MKWSQTMQLLRNLFRRRSDHVPAQAPRPAAQLDTRARRLRRRAVVAEDLTEWFELHSAARRLGCSEEE